MLHKLIAGAHALSQEQEARLAWNKLAEIIADPIKNEILEQRLAEKQKLNNTETSEVMVDVLLEKGRGHIDYYRVPKIIRLY
jgi:hypothetical protein